MTASIHVLHPNIAPVAGFLRVGHTGHRQLEALHAAGRFPFRRVVFDASHIDQQGELLSSLKSGGYEIVLDPNFAEMTISARFGSSIRKLGWAHSDRPWQPSDFSKEQTRNVARALAEFAVGRGVNVVLAPTQVIEATSDPWRAVGLGLCDVLRTELDRAGGSGIAVDYQLITTNALLKDESGRAVLMTGIPDLPIQSVWLRVSGFGATATGAGTRHFIEAVRGLHRLDRPLVADCVGGFPGLAAAAFGAVGGFSHGVCQKEGFKVSDWRRPSGGGGSPTRIYLPELDRYFTDDQLAALFSARGGRPRFACNDTSCCPNGGEDMVENSHAHFIAQRNRQIEKLSSVPEPRRTEHFLLKHLDPAIRTARYGTRLKISDEQVLTAVKDAKSRLVRLREALGDLHEGEILVSRSRSPAFRGGGRGLAALSGR